MKIEIPHQIIQSATNAQIRRAGSNFAESISAYLGNPITGEIIVSSSDKKGLVWIYGLGSEPSSSFTAVNTGLNKQDMYLGAPILVTRGVNGYNVTGKNPDTSPEFYEGSEALNAQEPIYINQLYYGTIHPYGASLQLLVIGGQYDDYDVVDIVTADFSTETVQDTLAANITLPTVNNTARGVLIQIDPSTETLSYKQSSTYVATIKPRQAYRAGLLPAVDTGKFRVGYFNLTYGVTAFTYGDIWSCPEFITSGDTGVLNNYVASAAPTANDDSGDGYSVGSQWFDVTNDNAYVLLDATITAAVWLQITAPLVDTNALVKGSADGTKRLRFEVDGITTATTRVITMPDTDLTLIGGSVAAGIVGTTDNILVRSDGTGGNKVQGGSGIAVSDTGVMTGASIDANSNTLTNIGSSEVNPDIITGQGNAIVSLLEADALMFYSSDLASLRRTYFYDLPFLAAPIQIHEGLKLRWLANDKIIVTGGSISHSDDLFNYALHQILTMGTAANWIDGASGEAASAFAHVYASSDAPNIFLHDTMPSSPYATGTYTAEMRVNQAGWNGTTGLGLNATSVVYDTDTNEGGISAGMLLGVYSDSAYTLGRGKGSAATATLQNMSFALITAVDTSTNTLTLEAGHNIAIFDNDYLTVVTNAPIVYRTEASVIYRWIGAMFNNASSNLDTSRLNGFANYRSNEGADYTTSSTSFGDIDGTNYNHNLILTEPGHVYTNLVGLGQLTTADNVRVDVLVDGTRYGLDDGLWGTSNVAATSSGVSFTIPATIPNLLPGTHNFKPQWKVTGASMTATLFAGAGTASADTHSTFEARIVQ